MKKLGGMPLTEPQFVVKCQDCERPVLANAFLSHQLKCSQAMSPSKQNLADVVAEKDAAVAATTSSPLKRKATKPRVKKKKAKLSLGDTAGPVVSETEGGDKASGATGNASDASTVTVKEEKTKKVKKPKPEKKEKPPVEPKKKKATREKVQANPDEHCCVPLGDGVLCTRSLTCKHHSMASKRAVAGRSKDYDTLLRLHQAKASARMAKCKLRACDWAGE
jgi:hypothetical protein